MGAQERAQRSASSLTAPLPPSGIRSPPDCYQFPPPRPFMMDVRSLPLPRSG
jgi:hypothetical protein